MDSAKLDLHLKMMSEYTSYMDKIKALPVEDVVRNIDEIAATKDVFTFLFQPGNLGSAECEYLLSVEEPLRLLRDQWLYNDKDISESMSHTIWEVCDRELGDVECEDDEDEYEP